MSDEIYKVIGLRDVCKSDKFDEFIKNNSPEANEIKNGYTNPLIVANIIRCRAKCLEDIN
jgi:hypothetical protein